MEPIVDPRIERYAEEHSANVPELLSRLERETQETMRSPQMLSGRTEGQFLRLLVKMLSAKRVLEVGTFTGYSALCMAEALPADGRILCCDLPGDYNQTAHSYWREAGVDSRIELRLGPALETLAALDEPESFDLVFIDADKANYPTYLEHALRLLRTGGLAVFDNVLWSGRVLETNPDSPDTRAIQALNLALKNDQRVDLSMLPVGDGLTLCRKR